LQNIFALQEKWRNFKYNAKSVGSNHKVEQKRTGGGKEPLMPDLQTEKILRVIGPSGKYS